MIISQYNTTCGMTAIMVMTPEERRLARNASSRKWAQANREKHRAAVRRCRQTPEAKERHRQRQLVYAAAHREQERLRVIKWREDHPGAAVAMRRRYYVANTKKVIDAQTRYAKANTEACKQRSRDYKGRKRAGGGKLSRGRIKALLIEQQGKCRACSRDLSETGYHLDHIVALARGGKHCDDNVQALCPTCNRRKNTKFHTEFLKVASYD
jgi:5-methylcytosine-specific restriction endonuclease McrA